MERKEIKKECLAVTGLSAEFSNSEVRSIEEVLRTVKHAVDKGFEEVENAVKNGTEAEKSIDSTLVFIDLRTANRVKWLLTQLTHNSSNSHLFDAADANIPECIREDEEASFVQYAQKRRAESEI